MRLHDVILEPLFSGLERPECEDDDHSLLSSADVKRVRGAVPPLHHASLPYVTLMPTVAS
jgi:hypothetical protein